MIGIRSRARLAGAVSIAFATATAVWQIPAGAQSASNPTAPVIGTYPGTIRVEIDASDVDRALIHGRVSIPVRSGGPATFYFPEWVPGAHGPAADIARIGGLTVRANGKVVPWVRDRLRMHAFHVVLPDAARSYEIEFDYMSPTDPRMGRIELTPAIASLQWTSFTPYPAGYASRAMTYQASLQLPRGWDHATSLETQRTGGDRIEFKPVDFETLVDSPVLAGRYHRRELLDSSRAPVYMDIFADRPDQLVAGDDKIEPHRELVRQAYKLFGSHHYDRYTFLVGLSSRMGRVGTEHHRSSENFTIATYFTDWDGTVNSRGLLPHELAHSWNGKFRRGADVLTATLDQPMQNSLVWVYEGLTSYLGEVLTARSGLGTVQDGLDNIAIAAASMQLRPGRSWRSLTDTGNNPIFASGPQSWTSWLRGSDYYIEGQLIWLDVDTKLRELSGEKRSIDDFAVAFHGIEDGAVRPVAYRLEDIAATLNRIAPFDWLAYLRARTEQVQPQAPLDGLARGGYRLIFTDRPTAYYRAIEKRAGNTDLSYSIGLVADAAGKISDVTWGGAAFDAKLTAGTEIVAVNGAAYDMAELNRAVGACAGRSEPLRLTVRRQGEITETAVRCTMGLRYPRLERDPARPARLDAILARR